MTEEAGFGTGDRDLVGRPTVYRDDLFRDRVVLVSGAGSGLGKAIAVLFARLGATVAICGRNEERLDAAARLLERIGARVVKQSMTIRDPEAVEALIARTWKEAGRLDVLVNNAGGQYPQLALEFKPKGWNAVIDTNLNGTWYMMQSAAKQWVEREAGGSIVNIVAVSERGLPGIAHTAAARAGVIGLSRTVAVEWAPYDIRVNCVAPGCVESTAFGLYPPEGARTFSRDANPMRRAGEEHDVAESVVYLAASSGKFLTGEVVNVDGGQRLWGDPWPTGRPSYFELS